MKKLSFLLLVFLTLVVPRQLIVAQTLEILHVEALNEKTTPIPMQCSPDDLIITINSSIPDLGFTSNVRATSDYKVLYYSEKLQYVICHPREKFLLTISGPGIESQDIKIFDLKKIHAYRATTNALKGTVTFKTEPGNAIVNFPNYEINEPTGKSITLNSGKYNVNIIKAKYKSIDTLITIQSNDSVTYTFNLEPNFAILKLDIKTEDNAKFEDAPIMWINDKRVSLDALYKPELYKNFYDGINYHDLYTDNLIPFEPGNYKIKIESKNYVPFETFVNLEVGKTTLLQAMLDLVYGFITVIDENENALGATVYINNVPKGQIPLYKTRTRVGKNIVRIEKKGFMTEKPFYEANVFENSEQDISVKLLISNQITINSDPIGAFVYLNNERIGLTPYTASIPNGDHELILKKSNFAPEKRIINTNRDFIEKDTLLFKLRKAFPIIIDSEVKKQNIQISGLDSLSNILIDSNYKTPSEFLLPYGNYFVNTSDFKGKTYKGKIIYSSEKNSRMKLPSYSRTSFTTLSFDYKSENDFEATFGNAHIFSRSGLSTSIANVNILNIEQNGKVYKTLLPYIFFTNWDWRLGGSLTRFLDINLLGRIKWTPGLEAVKVNIEGIYDASMLMYFYGFEISTRFSYFNIYTRIGNRTYKGEIFIPEKEVIAGDPRKINVNNTSPYITFGVRLNGVVGKSNNMLRLWYKPLSNRIADL